MRVHQVRYRYTREAATRPRWMLGPAALLLLCSACDQGSVTVSETPARLGPTPITLAASRPLEARHPTGQVCVAMDPAQARLTPRRTIVLLTGSGERDTLGLERDDAGERSRGPAVKQHAPGELCYWDHGSQHGRVYRAIELPAPDTLTVKRVGVSHSPEQTLRWRVEDTWHELARDPVCTLAPAAVRDVVERTWATLRIARWP